MKQSEIAAAESVAYHDHLITAKQVTEREELVGHKVPTFFAEYIDLETRRCYGLVHDFKPEPDRKMGAWGRKELTFTKPFEVCRGYKYHMIKATTAQPVRVAEHVYFSENE